MNQKFSIGLFAAGLPMFLATASEMLSKHNEWSYFYSTPLGFFHGLTLGASFLSLVVGALGVQLPRAEGTYGNRRTDVTPPPEAGLPGTTTTIVTHVEPVPPTTDGKA